MQAKTPVIPVPDRPKRWHGSALLKKQPRAAENIRLFRSISFICMAPLPPGLTARSTEMMHEINAGGK